MAFILISIFFLSACSPSRSDEDGPGKQEELLSPLENSSPIVNTSSSDSFQSVEATLYFRFRESDKLASESRTITASTSESLEKKVIEALIAGPSSATTELSSLFSDQTQVINTIAQEDMLIITFSDDLLKRYSDQPDSWFENEYWQVEAPLRKKLAMDSLAASIIESFRYQRVQILVQSSLGEKASTRLQYSYYLDPSLPNGTVPVLYYDLTNILTPYHSAQIILDAWQQKDWAALYPYVSIKDGLDLSLKPNYEEICDYWISASSLNQYTLSQASISDSGQQCSFSLKSEIHPTLEGPPQERTNALRLSKENGIWKVSFSDLGLLMGYDTTQEGGSNQ